MHGIISPIALLCDPNPHDVFLQQAMQIDKFAHLINHLDIGLILPVELDGHKTFVISIFEEYRDKIQSRNGQEPADD